MFHDMGCSLGIVRGGTEADIKYLVIIIIIQIHETGAALHVLHQIGIGIHFFNMRHGVHAKPVNHIAYFPFHIKTSRTYEKAQAHTCAFSVKKDVNYSDLAAGKNSS